MPNVTVHINGISNDTVQVYSGLTYVVWDDSGVFMFSSSLGSPQTPVIAPGDKARDVINGIVPFLQNHLSSAYGITVSSRDIEVLTV